MRAAIIFMICLAPASAALADPRIPDSKTVTSITEAASMCELTEAGIEWTEKSATVLAVAITPEDLQPPTVKMDLLKSCIFGWAYDRNVALEVTIK